MLTKLAFRKLELTPINTNCNTKVPFRESGMLICSQSRGFVSVTGDDEGVAR